MSEELVSIHYLTAMMQRHGNTPVMLEVTVNSLMCLAASAQLALRHPGNTGPSAEAVREFVLLAGETLGRVHPVFAMVIAQGLDTQFDQPAAAERKVILLEVNEVLGTVHSVFAEVITKGSDSQFDQPAAEEPWQRSEPPRDRTIVILGTLTHRDGVSTWVDPVCCEAMWSEGGLEWVDPESGMTIRHYHDDELRIHHWADLPRDREARESAPEVRVPAFTETREDGTTVQLHRELGVASGKGEA